MSEAFDPLPYLAELKCWLIIIELPNGKRVTFELVLSQNDSSQVMVEKLRELDKIIFTKKQRLLTRLLLKKRVVEIAKLSTVTGLDVAGVNGLRLFITAHPRDDTLTTAFHSPSVLAGAQEGSLADYAFLDNDLEFGRPPRNALVISTVPDHGARNVVRSLAMLLSFGLGIGLNFV